jgi:hypothetical protein
MTAFDQPLKDSGERTEFESGSVRDSKAGKGRYDLLPTRALHALARHFQKGAEKYGDRNWESGQPVSGFIDSGLRHAFKHLQGKRDEPHLVAAAWNLLAAVETILRIEEGLLPQELDDTPQIVSAEVTIEDGIPVFQAETGTLYSELITVLHHASEESDNSPLETLNRIIAQRNDYKAGYQHAFEIVSGLSSPRSNTADEDAAAIAAYTEKAAQVYGINYKNPRPVEDESIFDPSEKEPSACATNSCGCKSRTGDNVIRFFTTKVDENDTDDNVVYYYDEERSVVGWETHIHADTLNRCEKGESTMLLSIEDWDHFVSTGQFIPVSPTKAAEMQAAQAVIVKADDLEKEIAKSASNDGADNGFCPPYYE